MPFTTLSASRDIKKLARRIVCSLTAAKVLVLSLELCTLNPQETDDIGRFLMFPLVGDGCSAALASAEPVNLALDGFYAVVVQMVSEEIILNTRELETPRKS